jgi:hypothetical protein
MGAPVVDINIVKGKTFEFMYRYADEELVYLPISGMPSTAPVRLTVVSHGIPDGWPVRIESLRHPVELNNSSDDCYIATSVDPDTIELNAVRADGWRPYTSGGLVIFNRPFDLTDCSARMQIRSRVNGPILISASSEPLLGADGEIEVDPDLAALVVRFSPVVTADIEWLRGVYDLELLTPSGDIYPITAISKVSVGAEVTR